MKNNLDKANAALAAGRRDEGLVHAWNALDEIGPEADVAALVRLARTLDDPRLLREIENRGVSASNLSAAGRRWRRVEGKWFIPLLQALPLVAVLIIAVSVPKGTTEPGALQPTAKDTTAVDAATRPILAKSSGIWLAPLGGAARVNLPRLAEELAIRYHLPVRTLPNLRLPRWTLEESQHALVAEQLIRLLRQAYVAQGSAVVIGLTDFDMYARTEDLPHTFSWRAPPRYGVVSTSDLGARYGGDSSRHVRTRKLVARNIGFLYLHLREVEERHSLLRSRMHGVDDIDELDETL
jgi:hypothetical protein